MSAGLHLGEPTECGPYTGAAPAGQATIAMSAQTQAFDSTVTSTTGDFWTISVDGSTNVSPITINAGHSAEVDVTFTPSGGPGTVVRGNLYVDTITDNIPPYAQLAASEVAAIPYQYTIRRHRRR